MPRLEQLLVYLAANVRRMRIKAGLSQERLAELAELDKTFIQRVERGQSNISLSSLVRLANALGVEDIGALFIPADMIRRRVGRPRK